MLLAGVSGTFHLDDYQNLKDLAHVPHGQGWLETLSFGLSQISGATRVLPQLTFVLQAEYWPHSPAHFIGFNILLHLANGLLVFFLARALARLARLPHPERIGLFAAAIWLLSPIQVSGVLYVVQRINQMAAFFVFAGALTYLHGRAQIERGGLRPAFWMALGVFGGGALAVLSKENGALLPLLLLAAEATLLPAIAAPAYRRLRYALLGLPLLGLVAALAWQMPGILAGYAKRDFGLAERLLTQPGILFDYAQKFLLPRGAGLGLFHDDWQAAAWPPDTATWLVLIAFVSMFAAAVALRRRLPLFAFGVLWFLAGHALESSFIPLELYFEHRNYAPLFGPAFALAAGCVALHARASPFLRRGIVALAAGWLAIAAGVTYSQAALWGQPASLYEVWLHDHPESPRANAAVASLLARDGFADAARRRLEYLAKGPRPRPEYFVLWLQLSCDGRLQPPDFAETVAGLAVASFAHLPTNGLASIADAMETGHCPALSPLALIDPVRTLQGNPAYAASAQSLQTLAGRFLELGGKHVEALEEIGAAYRASGNPELGFIELRLLNALERRAEVEQRLDALERHIRAGGTRHARYLRDVENWRRHLGGDGRQDR